MTSTHTCLWCRNTLLRHVRRSGIYWFCNSCRQEIHPLLLDLGQTQRVSDPLQQSAVYEGADYKGEAFDDVVEIKIPLPVSSASVGVDVEADADSPTRPMPLQALETLDPEPSLSV